MFYLRSVLTFVSNNFVILKLRHFEQQATSCLTKFRWCRVVCFLHLFRSGEEEEERRGESVSKDAHEERRRRRGPLIRLDTNKVRTEASSCRSVQVGDVLLLFCSASSAFLHLSVVTRCPQMALAVSMTRSTFSLYIN